MNRPDRSSRVESKLRQARRRWVLGLFGRSLVWSLGAALLVTLAASLAPAFWVIETDFQVWVGRWLGGALAAAFLAATLFAALRAPSRDTVAAEIDRRFGLRERISSAIAIRDQDRDSAFGDSLLADAEGHAERLAIPDRFPLRPAKAVWVPAVTAAILAAAWIFVEPARLANDAPVTIDSDEVRQVKAATEELKKRIARQRRKAEQEGLEESQELFRRIEAELDDIARRGNLDRKRALIEVNELKKQLEKRRNELGSPDQIRRALSNIKGFESGPAQRLAESLEKGDFGDAEKTLRDLAKRLRDGDLSGGEREQLREQIEALRQQLEQAAAAHEQKKQELEQQIEQARNEGRGGEAARLQSQLDRLSERDGQVGSMASMADSLAKAADSMGEGGGDKPADALERLADQLGETRQDQSQLEELDSALASLDQSKNQMRCETCRDGQCQQCQGQGEAQGQGQGQAGTESGDLAKGGQRTRASGQGGGIGRGSGPENRSESESESEGYESQVRGDVRQGRVVVSGTADGPNRKGITREDLGAAIEAALAEESDPLETQTLPRIEQEQARQYFDRLREGGDSDR